MNFATKFTQLTKFPSNYSKNFIFNKYLHQNFKIKNSNNHKIFNKKLSIVTGSRIMTEAKKLEGRKKFGVRNFHFCFRNNNEEGKETKKGNQSKTKKGNCSSDNKNKCEPCGTPEKGLPNMAIEPKCKSEGEKVPEKCENKKVEEKKEVKCAQIPETKNEGDCNKSEDNKKTKCKSSEEKCDSKCDKPEDTKKCSDISSCKPLESDCPSPKCPKLDSCKKPKCMCLKKKETKPCEHESCPNPKNKCTNMCPIPDKRLKTTCYKQPCIEKKPEKKPEPCPVDDCPKKETKICPTQCDKCEKKEPPCPKKGSGCPKEDKRKCQKQPPCPPVKKRQEKCNVKKKCEEFDDEKKPKKTLCEDKAPPRDK